MNALIRAALLSAAAAIGSVPLVAPAQEVSPVDLSTLAVGVAHAEPAVAFDGTHHLLLWREDQQLWGARLDATGTLASTRFRIAPALGAGPETQVADPAAAAHGDGFVVVWAEASDGVDWNIRGVRVDGAGVVQTPFDVSVGGGAQQRPAVAAGANELLVVWEDLRSPVDAPDVHGVRISSLGTAIGPELVVSGGPGAQRRPAVASDGSGYLVVWERSLDSTTADVFGAPVDALGSPPGPELAIVPALNDERQPLVASNGSEYLVVWSVAYGGGTWDLVGARVGAAGVLTPDGIAIATQLLAEPPHAVASDGAEYLVAFEHDQTGGRAARVDALGARPDFAVDPAIGAPPGQAIAFGGGGRYLAVRRTQPAAPRLAAALVTVVPPPPAPGLPTYTNVGTSSLTVTWTPAASATAYALERGETDGGPWDPVATGLAATTYDDGGLAPNTTYWYRVRGSNAGGDGPSSQASVLTRPAAPSGVTFFGATVTSLSVAWTAPPGGATTYKVERAADASGSPGAWSQIASGLAATTLTDSGRAANTRYWYRVRATNSTGDGPYSTPASDVTLPSVTGWPTPAFTYVSQTSLVVGWTPPVGGAAAYQVERAPDAAGSAGPFTAIATVAALTYLDVGLTSGTKYWYRVRAVNASGAAGSYSTSRSVTTLAYAPVAAPGAPTFLSIAIASVTVRWTAAVGATAYKLERAPDVAGSPGAWVQIANVVATGFIDRGTTANTRYWYRVRAFNGGGDGPYSASSSVTLLPNAPSAVAFADVGATSLTVHWAAPVGGAAAYDVERATASVGPWTRIAAAVPGLVAADAGLKPNTGYWYRVRATNAEGSPGAYSVAATVTTAADASTPAPAAPGTPTFTSVTATSVRVAWGAASGAATYALERAPDAAGAPGGWTQVASVTTTTHLDSGRTANTAYWYRVRAANAGGDGPYSAPVRIITAPAAPGAPSFPSLTATSVTLAWTAPAGGAASYEIERAASASGPWTLRATGVPGLGYADQGLAANTTYHYRVRATNALGIDGASSAARAVTTPADPAVALPGVPGTPSFGNVTTTVATLTWIPATGATTYKVERAPDVGGSAGAWMQIAAGVGAPSYANGALAANTRYWYRVRATNAAGDGPYSGPGAVITAPTAPGAPTFAQIGATSLTVSWTAPSSGAWSYDVDRASTSTGPWATVASGVRALAHLDSGLTGNRTYWYRLRATNAAGLDGPSSSTRSVATAIDAAVSPPAAPGTPTYWSVTAAYVRVSWSGSATAASYRIERASDVGGGAGTWAELAAALTTTSYTNTGRSPNTAYWYRVRGTNAGGDGPYSGASRIVTAPAAPGAPTFGSVEETRVTLSWMPPAGGAATYDVERAALSTGPWTAVGSGGSALELTDGALAPGTTYWYRVRARNVLGLSGAYSPVRSATTLVSPPAG